MKLGFSVLFLVAFAFVVRAEDFDKPLASGVVAVSIQASEEPSAGLTRSVALRREDTGAIVFCAPAAAGETVEGTSEPIVNLGAEVLLSATAFDGDACSGLESLPSVDRYRVVFGAPGRPKLVVVE